MANLPPCPPTLKQIMHYLKIAQDHDERNVVVSYWARLHALQVGLKLSAGRKNSEDTALLIGIMDWLETTKKANVDNEAISNELCAKAVVEEYALKMFKYADEQDRAEQFNKKLVKAFYTCGIIMEILAVFGELSEDIVEKEKYAKWKAAYIHNCLKVGEKPIPGPMKNDNENELFDDDSNLNASDDIPQAPMGFINPNIPSVPTFPPTPPVNPDIPASDDEPIDYPTVPKPVPRPVVPTPTIPTPSVSTPYVPAPAVRQNNPDAANDLPSLSPELIGKAQKYCKWASSALNYDDIKTAIENLQKALQLLQTGSDPQ